MKEQPISFGYIESNNIYLAAWGPHDARIIGEVREDNIEKSIGFFTARFEDLEQKVNQVIEKIEATENKGSYLMKLIHLKDQLLVHDGLGDYQAIHNKLSQYEELIRDIIVKNRLRNTEIKQGLLAEAKEIGEILNWKEATEKVNDLKERWIKTGTADDENKDLLEEEFWASIKNFFDRKKHFFEDKQRLLERKVDAYRDLVKEAQQLEGLYGKRRFETVKHLKEKWRDLSGIPAEFYKPLQEKFNFLINKRSAPAQKVDYSPILSMLRELKTGKTPYSKKELDLIKANILKDRQRSPEKKQALDLIQLLIEMDFILGLTKKRFPDYSKMDSSKKIGVKAGIIKELIMRDKEELRTYEENSVNFSSSDGSLNRLVSGKIYNQKKKISIKEELLDMAQKGEL